jgi:hypothetical protein
MGVFHYKSPDRQGKAGIPSRLLLRLEHDKVVGVLNQDAPEES